MTSCCRAQNFVRLFQLNLIPVARSGGSFSHYQESRRARCALFPVLPRKAAVLYNLYEQKRQCMSSGSDMIKVGFEWVECVCKVNKELPRWVHFGWLESVYFLVACAALICVRSRTCGQTAGRGNSASRRPGGTRWQLYWPSSIDGALRFPVFLTGA